jgi:hypothetical protein
MRFNAVIAARRGLFLAAVALAADRPAAAQSLALSPLVQGQPFTLTVSGAPAPADVALVLGTGGIGAGTCFTPTFCLDLLDPWILLFTAPVDATGALVLPGVVPAGFPTIPLAVQAAVVSFAPGAPPLGKTPAVATTVQTLAAFSDAFAGPSLDPAWRLHEAAEMLPPWIANGALHLQPTATGLAATWFQNEEAPALFKSITGDFTVTAIVSATATNGAPGAAPPISYRLAGLIARDPASLPGDRNSVHVALGSGDAQTPLAVEDKTTDGSVSAFQFHPAPATTLELRLRRVGALFSMGFRSVGGGPFTDVASHLRPDLPATLDVGPMAYSNQAPAVLLARFDEVLFAP